MGTREELVAKAAQARRLAAAVTDRASIDVLLALAADYDRQIAALPPALTIRINI
jgi:hypothetical protein